MGASTGTHHAFVQQLHSMFSDSWFTEDQLGSSFAAALKPVPQDAAPHLPYMTAILALHHLAADGVAIEGSSTCRGSWRVRGGRHECPGVVLMARRAANKSGIQEVVAAAIAGAQDATRIRYGIPTWRPC
jgi:hypothetical protein